MRVRNPKFMPQLDFLLYPTIFYQVVGVLLIFGALVLSFVTYVLPRLQNFEQKYDIPDYDLTNFKYPSYFHLPVEIILDDILWEDEEYLLYE